jgi:stage IV sporulation protein FB
VLNAEPPHTPYDLHFRLAGFNVRVHPFFWLGTILLGANKNSTFVTILLWIITVFVSILIHELGHALAFRYFGKRSHVVLHSFGGLAVPDADYNIYGRSSRSDTHASQIIIALAGPGAGFLLAALVAMIVLATGHRFELDQFNLPTIPTINQKNSFIFVSYLMQVNILWGLINLLPVYPLDGGQVARQLFDIYSPHNSLRQSLIVSIAVGAGTAVVAVVRLDQLWMGLMFGILAFMSYQQLQQLSGGGYGGSEW